MVIIFRSISLVKSLLSKSLQLDVLLLLLLLLLLKILAVHSAVSSQRAGSKRWS